MSEDKKIVNRLMEKVPIETRVIVDRQKTIGEFGIAVTKLPDERPKGLFSPDNIEDQK
ncbi:MAG: hypothetical protein ABW096_09530 [Candidatus Thiodiazotropha sp.]